MNALQEAEQVLARLTRGEKALLLQRVAQDLTDGFPGIEMTPGVSGGEACIIRTRIPVWLLERARRLGVSDTDLLNAYPSLRPQDLANAWAYVRVHPAEIEEAIRENEEP